MVAVCDNKWTSPPLTAGGDVSGLEAGVPGVVRCHPRRAGRRDGQLINLHLLREEAICIFSSLIGRQPGAGIAAGQPTHNSVTRGRFKTSGEVIKCVERSSKTINQRLAFAR